MYELIIGLLSHPEILTVALAILGGVTVSTLWKLWRTDVAVKPHTYQTQAISVAVTMFICTFRSWAEGDSFRIALSAGVLYGFASPMLYLVFRWAAHRWAPGLACLMGEDRREKPRSNEAWTEEERVRRRLQDQLFGDSGSYSAEEIKRLKGKTKC